MKKMLLSVLMSLSCVIYAQDEPYISITSTEDYVELINPISVNDGEIWSSNSIYLLNFDFDFNIFDQTFSSLVVEAGGGISFPNSEYKSIRVFHIPFGGYLLKDKGEDISVSNIDYEVIGDEGHKIIKIQWKNAGFNQWFSTSDTADYVNFQIWIFQEDAHIELHFGSNQTDEGTYGYPLSPGPSIKFAFDTCSNILSYYNAPDDPLYDFFNMCIPNYSFIVGTPSSGITYSIIPTSQSCLPEGITFEYQSEIDSFQINYPSCTNISGDVLILGSDITNLNGLSVLTQVQGDLDIGSDNYGNPYLTDITGLGNLTTIGGRLYVSNNSALSSISDFNITSIGTDLVIMKNNSLTDLQGLENVTHIDSSLIISENSRLTSLEGLNNLTSTGDGVKLYSNESLNNLTALNNLTSIGGKLSISWNDSLTNLNGLDNINENSISDLEIYDNHSLTTCEVQSICDYLSNPNGSIDIHDNYNGCRTQSEIEEACSVGTSNTIVNNDFIIFPNPAKTEISIGNGNNLEECTIFNQFGQKLLHQTSPINKIDVSRLNQGIYIVELDANTMKVRKILIIIE